MEKLVEEKELLEKLRFELIEENRRKLLQKKNLINDNQQEIEKYIARKKLAKQNNINENLERQTSLSLPIKHEERIESYKNLINKLVDKIDTNVSNFNQFTSNISHHNATNIGNNPSNQLLSASQNYEQNNPEKKEDKDYDYAGKYNQGDNNSSSKYNFFSNHAFCLGREIKNKCKIE